jgi:hypothetical protein
MRSIAVIAAVFRKIRNVKHKSSNLVKKSENQFVVLKRSEKSSAMLFIK